MYFLTNWNYYANLIPRRSLFFMTQVILLSLSNLSCPPNLYELPPPLWSARTFSLCLCMHYFHCVRDTCHPLSCPPDSEILLRVAHLQLPCIPSMASQSACIILGAEQTFAPMHLLNGDRHFESWRSYTWYLLIPSNFHTRWADFASIILLKV